MTMNYISITNIQEDSIAVFLFSFLSFIYTYLIKSFSIFMLIASVIIYSQKCFCFLLKCYTLFNTPQCLIPVLIRSKFLCQHGARILFVFLLQPWMMNPREVGQTKPSPEF